MQPVLRIAVLSDLHLDLRHRHLVRDGMSEEEASGALRRLEAGAIESAREADLVVLAGDVSGGTAGIEWAGKVFEGKPVVYVAGNHEFYHHQFHALLPRLRAAAESCENVTFLENEAAHLVIRGRSLRVLGCILWTDYLLYGAGIAETAMAQASERLLDHKRIELTTGVGFQPSDALHMHLISRHFLEETLGSPFDGLSVVVTHYAPSPRSVAPEFHGDSLSPAFASDLTAVVTRFAPPLWIHGHTHQNLDYRIGATRVVAHQWGYPSETLPATVALVEI